jgi:hypothetical protein
MFTEISAKPGGREREFAADFLAVLTSAATQNNLGRAGDKTP